MPRPARVERGDRARACWTHPFERGGTSPSIGPGTVGTQAIAEDPNRRSRRAQRRVVRNEETGHRRSRVQAEASQDECLAGGKVSRRDPLGVTGPHCDVVVSEEPHALANRKRPIDPGANDDAVAVLCRVDAALDVGEVVLEEGLLLVQRLLAVVPPALHLSQHLPRRSVGVAPARALTRLFRRTPRQPTTRSPCRESGRRPSDPACHTPSRWPSLR